MTVAFKADCRRRFAASGSGSTSGTQGMAAIGAICPGAHHLSIRVLGDVSRLAWRQR